jgi:hypothetical protein
MIKSGEGHPHTTSATGRLRWCFQRSRHTLEQTSWRLGLHWTILGRTGRRVGAPCQLAERRDQLMCGMDERVIHHSGPCERSDYKPRGLLRTGVLWPAVTRRRYIKVTGSQRRWRRLVTGVYGQTSLVKGQRSEAPRHSKPPNFVVPLPRLSSTYYRTRGAYAQTEPVLELIWIRRTACACERRHGSVAACRQGATQGWTG